MSLGGSGVSIGGVGSLRVIKYVIPKSLKVGHWLNQCLSCTPLPNSKQTRRPSAGMDAKHKYDIQPLYSPKIMAGQPTPRNKGLIRPY